MYQHLAFPIYKLETNILGTIPCETFTYMPTINPETMQLQ